MHTLALASIIIISIKGVKAKKQQCHVIKFKCTAKMQSIISKITKTLANKGELINGSYKHNNHGPGNGSLFSQCILEILCQILQHTTNNYNSYLRF